MKKIWEYVDGILAGFRSCFSRESAFNWFVIAVVGFMLRSDHLGVTSIIRELQLNPGTYTKLIHFFHASSWTLGKLQSKWLMTVASSGMVYRIFGKPVLVGDGVKQAKEGKKMPCVKSIHQESGNSGKREYIMGQLFGGLGIIIGSANKQFCLPLSMTIQDGCRAILEWMKSEHACDSHVTWLVRQACKAAAVINEPCHLLMDAYFLSVPALAAIKEESKKCGKTLITLITRAKSDYVAFEKPGKYKGHGRPAILGKEVALSDLFKSKASFITKELTIYGKKEKVLYYCVNLLWGRGWHQELRFVLVICKDSRWILVSTDLAMLPEQIIELYCYRFKIEAFFRAFKQSIAGLACHFWSSHLPALSPFEHAHETAAKLAQITNVKMKDGIINTFKATEGFVMFCCLAAGILQLCALKFSEQINLSPVRFLRTYTNSIPSEESTAVALRDSFHKLVSRKSPKLPIAVIVSAERLDEDPPFFLSA